MSVNYLGPCVSSSFQQEGPSADQVILAHDHSRGSQAVFSTMITYLGLRALQSLGDLCDTRSMPY